MSLNAKPEGTPESTVEREWRCSACGFVYRLLARFDVSEVVSGGAPGVDTLAVEWAKNAGRPFAVFPADWKRLGKRAGPIRNEEMAVAVGKGGALIAIPDAESIGTRDMIRRALSHGLKVYVYEASSETSREQGGHE